MAAESGFTKIIVGVDGSEASVEALRQAQVLAGPMNADVEAIACWEFPQMYDGYVIMGIDGFEENARKTLEEAVSRAFGPQTPDNVRTRLIQGEPKSSLMEAGKTADMLVVGRRGRGGFGGLLLGSVSSSLIAQATCPVLVVHAPQD